ncbi:hypothetical protein DYH09_00850 [bacterium CPR1]|nr:hypothetical protein [bacterium CPR1]
MSQTVYLTAETKPVQVVLPATAATIVEVGKQGPAGTSGAGYIHTQAVAASTWIINHNLGYKPAVAVVTVGGAELLAEVLHTSINQTVIYLASAYAGSARLT